MSYADRVDTADWTRIAALYDGLAQISPSPVIELNRAVAYSQAFGPAAGLEILEPLRDDPALKSYHLLPAVRADFLAKLGRREEARAELQVAAQLTSNTKERRLLEERAGRLGS